MMSGTAAAQEYSLGPDSQRLPGVPTGVVTAFRWTSRIFPGTTRDYWVYVPAQYKPSIAAALMVFQDGNEFQNLKGSYRIPIVFDNLIHKGEMPVTIGVFIDPGVLPSANKNAPARSNRSFEYDAVTGDYARFLLEEILPVRPRSTTSRMIRIVAPLAVSAPARSVPSRSHGIARMPFGAS